jgi:tRNA pseudouridine38-40 synthase
LEIAYDGTEYHGWQSQLNGTTVQEALELQLAKILGAKINIMGCGRTDAGVHASHFILHFDYDNELPDRFKFRLNRMLPSDIAVYEAFEVTENFHSRFSATYRKYIYKTHFRKNPFQEGGSLFLFQMPSVDKMNEACRLLVQNDDFASFCKRYADGKTTICDLMLAEWVEVEYGFEFHVKANRFLRNMVRALVGTLLDVGCGTLSLDQLEQIIKDKRIKNCGGLIIIPVGHGQNWH